MAIGSANPDQPATTVGNLVLRRWLAQGGMAELYLASPADPARREVVVLKRVLPHLMGSHSFVRMFSREARLVSMLRHPNIVAVRDTGGLGAEDCYYTMEYVHGVDLGALLETVKARGGAVPLAHALTIAVAMCAGLHYAHEAHGPDGQPLGIVHRDVSPSNVLLGYDGAIKVTDFGVAKALAMTRLTEEGTRKGKLSYMSPEQATGETVDRRADVFAIATVLYEMTTMTRLFGGDNDLAVMYNILNRPRPSPREVSPGYPAALEAIVMRAVSADMNERFEDAQGLQRALEGFAASVGLSLSPEAVGAFIGQTMPGSAHPRDDPAFWAGTTVLRGSAMHPITSVQNSDEITLADQRAMAPTGPNPSVPLGTGPNPVVPLGTGPNPPVPVMTGPHAALSGSAAALAPPVVAPGLSANQGVVPPGASAAWTQGHPSVAPSALQKWSLVLALMALLVAVGVGVMVWQANRTPEPSETAPAAAGAVPAASPAPEPVAEPTPEPVPAVATPEPTPVQEPAPVAEPPDEPAPTSRRKGKRRTKKRTPTPSVTPAVDPPPPPTEPASKKPSPTDTLLPIRE